MDEAPASPPRYGLIGELKRRGVLRVMVTYALVGYGLIEAADLLFPRIGFGDTAVQALIALVFFGFPVALLTSWFAAREERRSTVHPGLLFTSAAVALGLSGWLGIHALTGATRRAQPVVVMMDSPLAARVYDEETLRGGGTNADVVNDILRDLPIARVKETVGPVWHRDEEMRRLDPDLILIHLSAFCPDECEIERFRLQQFLEYMIDTRADFLIYSRAPPDTFTVWAGIRARPVFDRNPELRERVRFFSLQEHGSLHWKNPGVAAALKREVIRILELE